MSNLEFFKNNKLEIKFNKLYINGELFRLYGYNAVDIIGAGANAFVIKAFDFNMNRYCAIKIWLGNIVQGKSSISRSKEEIKKISQFNHDNIVDVYSSFRQSKKTCLVMEYVRGKTLKKYLERHPELFERYKINMKILSGIRHAHDKRIYHGDLHLENILITQDYNIKILDFGTSVFSGKEKSEKRETRMIKETCLNIMGEQYSKLLGDNLEILTPFNTRILMKAFSKLCVLIDFSNSCINSINDYILDDISEFISIIPFFNIKEIIRLLYKDRLFTNENDNLNVEVLTNMKNFIINLYIHIIARRLAIDSGILNFNLDEYTDIIEDQLANILNNLNISFDSFIENMNFIFEEYNQLQESYIIRFNKGYINEVEIYVSNDDMEKFNMPLYSENYLNDYESMQRKLEYLEKIEVSSNMY